MTDDEERPEPEMPPARVAEPDKIKAARAKVDEALEEYLRLTEWDGVLTGWAWVGHFMNFIGGESVDAYPMMLMNDNMPKHAVLGLLSVADDQIRNAE